MVKSKLEFTEFTDFKQKIVSTMGATGGIYLPKDWIGKKVVVILLE